MDTSYIDYIDEIARRGGETAIESGHKRSALKEHQLSVADEGEGLVLMRAQAWRFYSRRYGSRLATLAYLCGVDDNGLWAARVPGSCKSVGAALEWLEPAAVKTARAAGKRILRQGDVYVIESTRDCGELPASHHFDAETRTLHHTPAEGEQAHAPKYIPFRARFVRQNRLDTARGRTRD